MPIRPFSHQVASARFDTLPALLLVAFLTIMTVACGSKDDGTSGQVGVPDEEGIRLTTRPESTYTIGDLTAVGFKTNKQFDLETVPGAIDIWYGFFQQQDIEVRFYESHAAALELGVVLAEEVIGKKAGQRDFLIPIVNLYPAYAVVGNTVMLCERQLSTCEALIDVLP